MLNFKQYFSDVYIEMYYSISFASIPFMVLGNELIMWIAGAVDMLCIIASLVRIFRNKYSRTETAIHRAVKELFFPYTVVLASLIVTECGGVADLGFDPKLAMYGGLTYAAAVLIQPFLPNKENKTK